MANSFLQKLLFINQNTIFGQQIKQTFFIISH